MSAVLGHSAASVVGSNECPIKWCDSLSQPKPPCCSDLLASYAKAITVEGGVGSVKAAEKQTVDFWFWQNNEGCVDIMGRIDLSGDRHYAAIGSGGFVDAINGGDGSCSNGCPDIFLPLCQNGTCKAPDCTDALPHCNDDTTAGERARMLCPVSCGCHKPNSLLLLDDPLYGCGSVCREKP